MKTVYKFSGSFCVPCKLMLPAWRVVKSSLSDKINFVEVDIEQNEILTREKDVVAVPTFIVEVDGKEAGRKTGMITKENLEKFILNSN